MDRKTLVLVGVIALGAAAFLGWALGRAQSRGAPVVVTAPALNPRGQSAPAPSLAQTPPSALGAQLDRPQAALALPDAKPPLAATPAIFDEKGLGTGGGATPGFSNQDPTAAAGQSVVDFSLGTIQKALASVGLSVPAGLQQQLNAVGTEQTTNLTEKERPSPSNSPRPKLRPARSFP